MRPLLAALSSMLLLSACATVPKLEAGSDIHAFLVAIRDGDRATFDTHVDKPALKQNLRARLLAETAKADPNGVQSLAAVGALIAGPLVDVAADALIRPEVFRAVAEMRGYSPNQPIPSTLAIAQFVRPLGDGLVCVVLKKNGPCVLDFKDEGGVYRLVSFEGDLSLLRARR